MSTDGDEIRELAEARAGSGTTRGIVRRDDAACICVETDDRVRFLVILLHDGDHWQVPELLDGTQLPFNAERSAGPPDQIAGLSFQQTAPPGPDRPDTAWTAVCGTAPAGVTEVIIDSGIDGQTVEIDDDGWFLGLVRAAWGHRPAIRYRPSPTVSTG
ncbi:hypothetical protein GIS00_16970 [Nakamurella sp. YIM 132087]|uniref:Uncharacterized protein n=1 Tax=Nakamurella alba TaxID=2665158 RepID=A0A7K1FN81_9ACTN|nr:hypothetical protein [Nakamurella alba]MTD15627.1 hypothetical protein [Nakamurella alba]